MSGRIGLLFTATAIFFAFSSGCTSQPEWEVTIENKGDVSCSFFVTMRADGSSKANMKDVAKGKAITLIVGNGDTIVHTVRVVRDKTEQVLEPRTHLQAGKRYAIVVDVAGKVETSVKDK